MAAFLFNISKQINRLIKFLNHLITQHVFPEVLLKPNE